MILLEFLKLYLAALLDIGNKKGFFLVVFAPLFKLIISTQV